MSEEDNRWMPRHHDLQTQQDSKKILSVTEASRLHEGSDVSVRGVISGIQPLRKMIKGLSCECMNCHRVYERRYDKPELFESFVPIERIKKCSTCNSGEYLGRFRYENINAVIVELKDCDTFSEIDPLRIIVFGDNEPAYDNTRNIDRHIGETVIVKGDIYSIDVGQRGRSSKVVAYQYIKYLVQYLSKQDIELTSEDEKAVKRFVKMIGQDNVVTKLTDMFATSIIGNNYVKKGLLLSAASTSLDKKAKKLHAILVGDSGLAKSELLKAVTKLVPDSRYESVQFATGKSLTAIVSKEESDALILRIGPIAQAKGGIAALNEITGMSSEDQRLMLDTMQEQEFTTNKYGQNFHVDAPTAIIASANPIGGSWKTYGNDELGIDLDEIPMIKLLIDRFDFIFIFKDNRDKAILTEYAYKKSDMEDRPVPDYTPYIKKHIMYAKQHYPKPKFSEDAKIMLNEYFVNIRLKYGSPRIRETIYRIAENIARLKLKNVVDIVDAEETMKYYNFVLQQLDKIVAVSLSPRDTAYQECLNILKNANYAIAFDELKDTACKNKPQVARYIGKDPKLESNKKLRTTLDMLRNHSRVKAVQMRPVVLQYIRDVNEFTESTPETEDNTSDMVKACKQASDLNDLNDVTSGTPDKISCIHDENPIVISNLSTSDDSEAGNPSNISHTTESRSLRSLGSLDKPNDSIGYIPENGNGKLFKCYYCPKNGKVFETDIERDYLHHGDTRHHNKPMYPNSASMLENGLEPQGKEWEV